MMTINELTATTTAERNFYFESHAIESITVKSHGGADLEVTITFKGDRNYGYSLPADVVLALLTAESVGRCYNTMVKGKYHGERL